MGTNYVIIYVHIILTLLFFCFACVPQFAIVSIIFIMTILSIFFPFKRFGQPSTTGCFKLCYVNKLDYDYDFAGYTPGMTPILSLYTWAGFYPARPTVF